MTRELLDIASNHADGEEAVTATLSTPEGKGKQVVDHGASRRKRRMTRRHNENLVVDVECKASRPKGNQTKPAPSKDQFERLLDAPCPHHEVPVKHLLKDWRLIKNYVNGTLKPRTTYPPKKRGPPPDNDDGVVAMYPGKDGAMHMIFGVSPARPSRWREKLIR
jgi:hypothetical protein